MEIRNNYNSATTFGTKIPQPIKNRLFEMLETPSAKIRERKDRKNAITRDVMKKIDEIEKSNSDFFELTIMTGYRGKDSFGLKEANKLAKKKIEIMTIEKTNLLSKFLSLKPEVIKCAEQSF